MNDKILFKNYFYKKNFCAAAIYLKHIIVTEGEEKTKVYLSNLIKKEEPAIFVKTIKPIIGITGSGGSTIKTFNVGTVAAFISSGAGVVVAKTGTQKINKDFGTADILSKWGVNIRLNKELIKKILKKLEIAFIFSEDFCPWVGFYKYIKQNDCDYKGIENYINFVFLIRSSKEINFSAKLNGIKIPQVKERALCLQRAGLKKAIVVHGLSDESNKYLDEFSVVGESIIAELNNGKVKSYTLKPEDFGISRYKIKDIELQEQTLKNYARLSMNILDNKFKNSPMENLALTNAALAIHLNNGKCLKECFLDAKKSLRSGEAIKKLYDLIKLSNF